MKKIAVLLIAAMILVLSFAACSGGAPAGNSSSDAALRAAAGTATWLDGRRFPAGASAEDVLGWANGLGIQ